MENHHVSWVYQLWPFPVAMLVYQRVSKGILPLLIPLKRQASRTLRVAQWMPLSLQRSLTKAGSWRKLGAGHRACCRLPKIWADEFGD